MESVRRSGGTRAAAAIMVTALLAGGTFTARAAGDENSAERPPASPAATEPLISSSEVSLRHWITLLGDDDPSVRDSASQNLMGLRREDLPAVQAAAMAMRPLSLEQISRLHEIVLQVYLASEPYPAKLDMGFLGLYWPAAGPIIIQGPGGAMISPGQTTSAGVIVASRFLGFCAYRELRPGDVIVKLLDHPGLDLHQIQQFTSAVGAHAAGQILRMQVLRYGQLMDVAIVLDPRPLNPDLLLQVGLDAREKLAEDYWNTQFAACIADLDDSPTTRP